MTCSRWPVASSRSAHTEHWRWSSGGFASLVVEWGQRILHSLNLVSTWTGPSGRATGIEGITGISGAGAGVRFGGSASPLGTGHGSTRSA